MGRKQTPRPWSVADLKQRTRDMHDQVRHMRVAGDDEIAPYRPGGRLNNAANLRGQWTFYYGRLAALLDRSRPKTDAEEVKEKRDSFAALGKAARREPVTLAQLSIGVTLRVFPKSFLALRFLDSLKASHMQMVELLAAGSDAASTPTDLKLLTLVPLRDAFAVQVWAWVVTHPEPRLPFSVSADLDESLLPSWTQDLAPEDLLALASAHIDVNRTRLELIAKLSNADGITSSLPIEGFVSHFAGDKGLEPYDVLANWSLGEVYASAVSASIAIREAEARAKQEQPPLTDRDLNASVFGAL